MRPKGEAWAPEGPSRGWAVPRGVSPRESHYIQIVEVAPPLRFQKDPFSASLLDHRQFHGKSRSVVKLAGHTDPAPMGRHDLIRNPEPESDSLETLRRLRPFKSLEELGQGFFGNPDP